MQVYDLDRVNTLTLFKFLLYFFKLPSRVIFFHVHDYARVGIYTTPTIKHAVQYNAHASIVTVQLESPVLQTARHTRMYNKSINSWFLCLTLDLSALASGLVIKNRTLGFASCSILMTRPEARVYKSNVTLGPMH